MNFINKTAQTRAATATMICSRFSDVIGIAIAQSAKNPESPHSESAAVRRDKPPRIRR